jgi:Nuclease-related domain
MLIKQADDKSKRLELLQELQKSPLLDHRQKEWLRDELVRTQRGIQGERDAAHYIDTNFKDSATHAVIHDLRLVVDGEVAQIDHLIVNRVLHFYLFETKCFNGEVTINDRAEFTVRYGGERLFGIPSPLEQSRRHEKVIAKLLEKLNIQSRTGAKATFAHAVLFHPKAIIHRPPTKDLNTDFALKADQIGAWHKQYVDRHFGVVRALTSVANVVSEDSMRDMAEKIARQHRPVNPLDLPDFMKPRAPMPAAAPTVQAPPPPGPATSPQEPAGAPPEELRRKLVCVACGDKISFAEGKYCWNNEARFGGFQYCRSHQDRR